MVFFIRVGWIVAIPSVCKTDTLETTQVQLLPHSPKIMKLTKGQKEILQKMKEFKDTDDGELVYEKGSCYLGCDRVDSRIFFGLLRRCAISAESGSEIGRGLERYYINSTGIDLLTTNS